MTFVVKCCDFQLDLPLKTTRVWYIHVMYLPAAKHNTKCVCLHNLPAKNHKDDQFLQQHIILWGINSKGGKGNTYSFTFTVNLKHCFVFTTNITQIQVAIYSQTSVLWKQHGCCKTFNLKRKVYMPGKTDSHIMSASSESTSDLYLYAFVPALLICACRKQNHSHPNINTFIFLYNSISRHPSPESHNAHISCSIHSANRLPNNM